MVKETYERAKLEIIRFLIEDALLTSGPDEYEGWNPYNSGEGNDGEYEGWNPYDSGKGGGDEYEGWNPH